jgi:hypothetical protein
MIGGRGGTRAGHRGMLRGGEQRYRERCQSRTQRYAKGG